MITTVAGYRRTLVILSRVAEQIDQVQTDRCKSGRSKSRIDQRIRMLQTHRKVLLKAIVQFENSEECGLREFNIRRLSDLGWMLIRLRAAAGISQRELAKRLKVAHTVIVRDERNEHRGISIERVGRILSALNFRGTVTLKKRGA